ncbi:MAG: trypsin-like serine protease, partial [Pseudomonadota bacterium]
TAEHKPWKAVGRVNVAALSETSMCTGTLISPDIVLTAAHCVFSNRTGQVHAVGNVHFVAGWRRGTRVAHRKAVEIVVHPGYAHGGEITFDLVSADVALIRLAEPIPPDVAPAFPMAEASFDVNLTLISYRQDRAHALTRQDGCDLDGSKGTVLVLDCDVTFGASGSPVFADVDGRPAIVAVISAKGRNEKTRRDIAYAVRAAATVPGLLDALP